MNIIYLSLENRGNMSFEERYQGFCVDLIKVNTIYPCPVTTGVLSFEERYE
jgi:hypothetical protein